MLIDGEPWFVLSDVCQALELASRNGYYGRHAEKLESDQKRLVAKAAVNGPPPLDGEGSNGSQITVISESGLYTLALRSDKPSAKRFRRWITSKVLPSIRKTGRYGTPDLGDWQPFHDRITSVWGAVPEGYFSIFKEMVELTGELIRKGLKVGPKTIPDISLGLAWGKEWRERSYEEKFGKRLPYAHSYPPGYPQAKSNPQPAYCYPEEALGVFRKWFRQKYLPDGLPNYLNGQQSKGAISYEAKVAFLTAAQRPGIAPPQPRK